MILKKNRWGGTFMSCSGFPECRNAKPIAGEARDEAPLPEVTDAVCDLCGKPMTARRRKRDGSAFLGCTGYPRCRNVRQLPGAEGAETAPPVALPEVTDAVCDQCGKPMAVRQNRWGSPFLSCTGYPKCKNARPIPTGASCPKCGGELLERRAPARKGRRASTFYGCANYPACDFSVNQRPLPNPCPECDGLLVMQARDGVKCTRCAYQVGAAEPEPAAAEA